MKTPVAYNAIVAEVKELFSIQIPFTKKRVNDLLLPKFSIVKGKKFVYRAINTRNYKELLKLAEYKLDYFTKKHQDNSKELFIELSVKRAKELQKYFQGKKQNTQKEYYYSLQRWIDFLQRFAFYSKKLKGALLIDWEKSLSKTKTEYKSEVINEIFQFERAKYANEKNESILDNLIELKRVFALNEILSKEHKEKYDLYNDEQKKDFMSRVNLVRDELQKLGDEFQKLNYNDRSKKPILYKKKETSNFSHKQIAIAYCAMGIFIDSKNAIEILQRHSQARSSDKLMALRMTKLKNLTSLTDNKTADTKHLNTLLRAEQLVNSMKKEWKSKSAGDDINRILRELKAAYDRRY